MTRRTALEVRGHTVRPGRVEHLDLPASRLPSGAEVTVPLVVVHGQYEGPFVWLAAAVHGDELNGVEIIRRVLGRLSAKTLRGTVMAVPILNVYGFAEGSRYLPDRRDLNRSFPGSARGSLAARLAHMFVGEVLERCDLGIDLHTGAAHRTNLPQIRANLEDERTRTLAEAFGAPVSIHSAERDGSLRAASSDLGKPSLLFEGGEALRFDADPIQVGEAGVMRVLAHEGMVDAEGLAPPKDDPFIAKRSRWLRAGRAGLFHLDVEMGERVQKDEQIGRIEQLYGAKPLIVRSPASGVVIGHATNPIVYRGDAILHVAEA